MIEIIQNFDSSRDRYSIDESRSAQIGRRIRLLKQPSIFLSIVAIRNLYNFVSVLYSMLLKVYYLEDL